MDDLVLNNLKLVYVVLKKLNLYEQRDYYYEIGVEGLVKAAKTYKPDKGYQFSTYACRCIRNAVLMDIRNNKKRANDISLDAPVEIKDTIKSLYDLIESDFDLEAQYEKKELVTRVYRALFELSDEEKKLYYDYFKEQKPQQQIAKEYKCSQAQISRRLNKLIIHIKHILDEKGIYKI